MYDIAVIGAGAAGLTAAIFAGRAGARVVALDSAPRLGAKILIAGGGRCNVTHDVVTPEDFNGSRNAIAKVLRSFPVEETVRWFDVLGVTLKREDTGKLFPVTDRARSVLDALVNAASAAGVEIRTSARVETMREGFIVSTTAGQIEASRVILATGGRSVPRTGSDGHGYEMAASLGHTVTHTFPALVPLVITEPHWFRESSGTSADVQLAVTSSTGRVLARQRGSMLLTHFGISGPVALDISRHWIEARRVDRGARLLVSFLPDSDFESVEHRLLGSARRNPQATVASALRGMVPERILERIAPQKPIAKLTREERRAAVRNLIELVVPLSGDRGFDYAEVTAGGVPLNEVNLATMESRRRPGLFLCGEVLDVDGRIGGYNFQWAWASGRLAGLAAARRE
ncbi:MAG TPA: NAD(P)/FAD-dependent oxidoreductase [Thermoanaerobaculia bacterium]|nr:NAD(P)/FAD-dependent oxidoreductase [Thermoanaerobaculia bacterium]